MNTTPVSLLDRLRQPGQPRDWERFVELYTPFLLAWAHRLGLRGPAVDDLVQEVFLLLVRKLPEFEYRPGQSFRAWLRTVAVNRWRELRRRRAPLGQQTENLSDVADTVEEPFWEEEYRRHIVGRALTLLRGEFPVLTWQAFEKHVVEGHDAAAVAAELGLKVGSVYAAKSRVLTRLRRELEGCLD